MSVECLFSMTPLPYMAASVHVIVHHSHPCARAQC